MVHLRLCCDISFCVIWVIPGHAKKHSVHGAMWGIPGQEQETSMHLHNWLINEDETLCQLHEIIGKLQKWDVPVEVQVQLVSMLCVFNGKNVACALLKCKSKSSLPIQSNDLLPDMENRIMRFVEHVLAQKQNPLSIRFRCYMHNAFKDQTSTSSSDVVVELAKQVLTSLEARSLAKLTSYTSKLKMLSRVKGYASDVEQSFLGKNLLNILSALGEKWQHLCMHVIENKNDHPNGPGAIEYFQLNDSGATHMEFRKQLIAKLKIMWPSNISVDGVLCKNMHLFHDAEKEVNAETVQFSACQCKRIVDYVVCGKIPAHLARNRKVEATAVSIKKLVKTKCLKKRVSNKQLKSKFEKRWML